MNQSGISTYGAAVSGRVIATLAGVQAVLPAHRRRVGVLSHRCALLSAGIGLANPQKLGVMTRRSIQCWRATVLGHCVRLGIFARANTSQPRNLVLVCHQLRAETTYLPYTFKTSIHGGIFYSNKSRVKVIRLRIEQKSAWE
jgi:hypothetical protein